MINLTIAQKIYLAALLAVAGAWLGLQVGVPIYEYSYGKSELTALLSHLSWIMLLAAVGIAALGWILQSMGILPVVQREAHATTPFPLGIGPVGGLRNLAIWIVIAALLVILFNLFDSGGGDPGNTVPVPAPTPEQMPSLMSIFINWFPMLLIFGVWVFFLRQMRVRQNNDTEKPKDS